MHDALKTAQNSSERPIFFTLKIFYFMLPMLDDSSVMTIAFASCAGVVGLLIVLALVINHFAVQKGAGNLMKLE